MRAAPPVEYPLARRGLWDAAASALAACAGCTPAAWAVWHLQVARVLSAEAALAGLAAGGLIAILSAMACWRAAGCRAASSLRWDGTRWEWQAESGEAITLQAPHVCIDLGSAMLLRASPERGGATVNLAIERRHSPSAWHGLRVALAQGAPRRKTDASQPAQGAAA